MLIEIKCTEFFTYPENSLGTISRAVIRSYNYILISDQTQNSVGISGNIEIRNEVRISNNVAGYGGGIYIDGAKSTSPPMVSSRPLFSIDPTLLIIDDTPDVV